MEILDELSGAFLILIRSGVILRIIYCFVSMMADEEQSGTYKKRIKNTVVFYVMAESIWLIKDLIARYYLI